VLLLASEFTKIMGFGCWRFIYIFLTGILFFHSFCYSEKGMVLPPCIQSIHIMHYLYTSLTIWIFVNLYPQFIDTCLY
jgi:hypothetical protein